MRFAAGIAAGIAVAALLTAGAAAPAQAFNYPWCAQYNSEMLGRQCMFMTLQQCRETVSGVGGFCDSNPWYQPPAKAGKRKRKRKKR